MSEEKKCAACENGFQYNFPRSWWSIVNGIGLVFLSTGLAFLFLFMTALPKLITGALALGSLLMAGTILCKFIQYSVIGKGFYFFIDKDDQFHVHHDKPFRDKDDKPYWNSAIMPENEIPGAILWISTSKFRKPTILPQNEKNWIPTRVYFKKCTGNYATWMIELAYCRGAIKKPGAASPRVRVEMPSALRLINSNDYPIFGRIDELEQALGNATATEKELREQCSNERFFGDFVYRLMTDIHVGCARYPRKSQPLQYIRMFVECLIDAQAQVFKIGKDGNIRTEFDNILKERTASAPAFKEFVGLMTLADPPSDKKPAETATPAPATRAGA